MTETNYSKREIDQHHNNISDKLDLIHIDVKATTKQFIKLNGSVQRLKTWQATVLTAVTILIPITGFMVIRYFALEDSVGSLRVTVAGYEKTLNQYTIE